MDQRSWENVRKCLFRPIYRRRLGVTVSKLTVTASKEQVPWLAVVRLWPPKLNYNFTTWGALSSKDALCIAAASTFVPETYLYNEFIGVIKRKLTPCSLCRVSPGYMTLPIPVPLVMSSHDSLELIDPIMTQSPDDPSLISWGNKSLNLYFDEAIQKINLDIVPPDSKRQLSAEIRLQKKERVIILDRLSSTLVCFDCLTKRIREQIAESTQSIVDEVVPNFVPEDILDDTEELMKTREPLRAQTGRVAPPKVDFDKYENNANHRSIWNIPQYICRRFIIRLLLFIFLVSVFLNWIVEFVLFPRMQTAYYPSSTLKCTLDENGWLQANPDGSTIEWEDEMAACLAYDETTCTSQSVNMCIIGFPSHVVPYE